MGMAHVGMHFAPVDRRDPDDDAADSLGRAVAADGGSTDAEGRVVRFLAARGHVNMAPRRLDLAGTAGPVAAPRPTRLPGAPPAQPGRGSLASADGSQPR